MNTTSLGLLDRLKDAKPGAAIDARTAPPLRMLFPFAIVLNWMR
jgi:hypothetical protein